MGCLRNCFLAVVAAVLTATTPASARDVLFNVEPRGATIRIVNLGDNSRMSEFYTAPVEIDFRSRSAPYILEVSAPGYESKQVSYDYRDDRRRERFDIKLPKLVDERTVSVRSNPAGAKIWLEDRTVGVTPATVAVTFTRSSSSEPWRDVPLVLRREGFRDLPMSVGLEAADQLPVMALTEIRKHRQFTIAARTLDGLPLPDAVVKVDGEERGRTPLKIELEFRRRDAGDPWTEYQIECFLENAFEPTKVKLEHDSESPVILSLDPVTELEVTRYFPVVEHSPSGPERGIERAAPIGTLDVQDISYKPLDFRPVTNFQRDQPILQAVNSFCLTPDGQSLIYSVTMQAESGEYYANLFIKGANDTSLMVSQLTRGNRFLDCNPTMSREEGSNLVVFQSNRGPMDSWDISSLNLRDGRVVGGIRQLTRDRSKLNYGPTLVSEALPVYFSSADTYPQAQAYISYVRPDGSSFTNLGEFGEQLVRTEGGLIYFTRRAEDTGKMQIYSISSEGLQFSSVINDIEFGRANCLHPAVSPDGKRLLFVSDYHTDEKGRPNNNIYIYEVETGIIQPLTDNGSDDVKPVWSPTERGVLYFLSNRGGIYNIWRMQISLE